MGIFIFTNIVLYFLLAVYIVNFSVQNKPSFKIFPNLAKSQINSMLMKIAIQCASVEKVQRPDIILKMPKKDNALIKRLCEKYSLNYAIVLKRYSETADELYSMTKLPHVKNYCRIYLIIKSILECNRLQYESGLVYYINIFLPLAKSELQSIDTFIKICSFEALNDLSIRAEIIQQTSGIVFSMAKRAVDNIINCSFCDNLQSVPAVTASNEHKISFSLDIKDCPLITETAVVPLNNIAIERYITVASDNESWHDKFSKISAYLFNELPNKLIDVINNPYEIIDMDIVDFLGMFIINQNAAQAMLKNDKVRLYYQNRHYEFLQSFAAAFCAVYSQDKSLWRDNAERYKHSLSEFNKFIRKNDFLNILNDSSKIKLSLFFLWTLQLVLDCEEFDTDRLELKSIIADIKLKLNDIVCGKWDSILIDGEFYLLSSITETIPDYFLANLYRCRVHNALMYLVVFEQLLGLRVLGDKIVNINRRYVFNQNSAVTMEFSGEKLRIRCTPKRDNITRLFINGTEYGNINSINFKHLKNAEIIWEI